MYFFMHISGKFTWWGFQFRLYLLIMNLICVNSNVWMFKYIFLSLVFQA